MNVISSVQKVSVKQAALGLFASVGLIATSAVAIDAAQPPTLERFEFVSAQGGVGSTVVKPDSEVEVPPAPAQAPEPAPAPAPEPPKQSVPLDDNIIVSPFEYRYGVNPLLPADYPELHNGLDFAGDFGDGIYSVKPGHVVSAGWHHEGGGGNRTVIDHEDGTMSTYNHQQEIFITTGDRIEKGQLIGSVGSTGNSTGSHLHFEYVWNGVEVDPAPLMDEFNE